MKKLFIIVSLFFILGGCASPVSQGLIILDKDSDFKKTLPVANANYGKSPKNYQYQIKLYMSNILKDPESAKYSNLTKPFKSYTIYKQNRNKLATHNDVYYGYSVCFSLNAKNSYGAYTGNSTYVAFFHNGKIRDIKEANIRTGIASAYIGSSSIKCPSN